MRVVVYILIFQSSESLGPRGLRRGVCPTQVLSSVRDLAALRGDIGVDFMGGEQIPDGCVAGCLWSLQLFPDDFWIEISPDVFLKGAVGEWRYLFDMKQIIQLLHSLCLCFQRGWAQRDLYFSWHQLPPQYSSHHRIHLLIVRP